MGRSRNKYKTKPRVVTDESEQKKIKVEVEKGFENKYDESNALVIPSKKRSTKKLRDKNAAPVKLLSKKKRKLLQKIVEKKKKKADRTDLLAALQEVRADPKDLEMLTQLQSIQTLGRKRFTSDGFTPLTKSEVEKDEGRVLSSIKGKKRTNSLVVEDVINDPNVVRLGDISSDESEYNDSDEEEVNEMKSQSKTCEEVTNENVPNDSIERPKEISKESIENTEKCLEKENTNNAEMDNKSLITDNTNSIKPVNYVILNRSEAIQKARLKLPILSEEQAIMEAINENSVIVIVGTTGSGKTTQVPQFLYEAGYARNGKMIGITEPRRVAAISMSQRVGYEMNLTSHEVSYQIRFEGNTTPDTQIKFMTDGVLLKEIQLDPTLKKYSVIIIDEAHERSIFSDILIGILSRIIPVRLAKGKPLKLIIMSATLRVEDFTENIRLFKNPKPPVLKVEARMFDVTIHYNKRTLEDYLEEAYKKACKIHRQLPEGGILVFLTGQQEVNTLVKKLRRTFPMQKTEAEYEGSKVSAFRKRRCEMKQKRKLTADTTKKIVLPEIKLDDFVSALPDDADMDIAEDAHQDVGNDSDLDLGDDIDEIEGHGLSKHKELEQPMWVLPLYSVLPPDRQQMVFQPPPEGTRLCIVATNVAETSLTIPNVKYVVDSGKVKEKVYDKTTGVSMFHVTWTSQASANQRAGRAGRTAPGHCYRLYSSAVFNDEFQTFSPAEIQQRPIDDIVLIMKSMKLPVINFPFPTPPDYLQIRSSMKRLTILGALKESVVPIKGVPPTKIRRKDIKDLTYITALGKAMAAFPLAPRYGKMLALSHQHSLLPYTVAIVAALTIPEVLLETPVGLQQSVKDTQKQWHNLRLSWAGVGNSRLLGDVMVLLRCIGAAEFQGGDRTWCEKNGLRHKAITEIRKLRRQLTNEINLLIPSCDIALNPKMPPTSDEQALLLRQIVLSGLIDHVARRVDDWEIKDPADKAKWKYAYRTQELEEPVFLPSSSVLRVYMPQWVVYQDIYETHKMFMRNVTVIEPQWLAVFAPELCSFTPPLESPEPCYDETKDLVVCHRSAKFGSGSWELPDVEVEYPHSHSLFLWVAYFLLAGELCPCLQPYVKHLYEPRVMVNPVAIRYRQQRETLLQALMNKNATNRAKLFDVWSKEPSYLLNEYLLWVEDTAIKKEIRKIWPPMQSKIDCNQG
ncbi:ATP-dependent RNA helicase dhx37 [Halocaridina rubra]|uniref:RNA helicase n=1 Tax=Halocaridina rubra TaxID=373956 RepID=A0AAN8XM08_HALRR